MARVCPNCGAEVGEEARFCASCGTRLEPEEGAERKLATIVFADLVGSTRLASQLDPEELRRRLKPFFELARATLEEHGGTVEKYIGDAVMAVFGAPRAHSDDPDRAVAAALELSERLSALDQGLEVRVGVETGEVLALDAGGDLSVTGEPVNAAARLQQAAAPGEVLVGARAAQACRASKLAERDAVDAKGFATSLPAWSAVGVESNRRAVATPFVGRDDDLAMLDLIYRRTVRDRAPELVTITGEAGVGKTRLATELTERLRSTDPGPQILLGRNPPYGRGIAFWALGEIVRAAAGAGPDESVSEVHDLLEARLAEMGAEDTGELVAPLATALGGESSDGDVEEDLKRSWRRLVSLLATDRPLVIGIDDAHWADDGLLDLLEEVVFRLSDVPLLVLCTTRPELLERRPDFGRAARNVTQIELRPLTREATDALALALLPGETRELAPKVAEVSGGNPFFAEEVARAVTEGRGIGSDRLPDTVQAAIAARLDLLPAEEKRVLQHASVLGTNFLEPALADLLGQSPTDALEDLMRKALVQERLAIGPGRYGFRHQLIRDVAYSSLPKTERARLHERAADDILGRAGERYAELAEIVAYHRVQAADLAPAQERTDAARAASLEAAEVAARRGATARAQELLEQAAELCTTDRERAQDLGAAAELALQRWRGDQAIPLLQETARVFDEVGDARQAASAYARMVEVVARMGGISGELPEPELEQMLKRARELVPDDDIVTRSRIRLDEAWMAWRYEHEDDMAEPARVGLDLARQTEDIALLSGGLDAAAAVAWNEARFDEAVGRSKERIDLLAGAPRTGHMGVERSDALHMTVESLVAAGHFREAAGYAAQGRELDLSVGAIYSGWGRGILPAFFLGEWDEVMRMAEALREAWTAADRPPIAALAGTLACAGAVLGYQGRDDESSDWFRFAMSVAPRSTGQASGVLQLRGDYALHRGRPEEAAELMSGPPGFSMWWRPSYVATRCEAFVRARDDRAAEALADADRWVGDHGYARALLLRARAQAIDDEDLLREALGYFDRVECPYQAARTGWMLGGEERDKAERTLASLGATLPEHALRPTG